MALWFVIFTFLFLLWPSNGQIKFCEKICPVNEVYSNDVSQCQNTCFNQNFNETFKCSTAPGCVCKKGYMRDQETYKCIPKTSCSIKRGSKHCPSNEFHSSCDAECFKTCQNKKSSLKCRCVSGCACRTGYVRSDINFQCVPENFCSS